MSTRQRVNDAGPMMQADGASGSDGPTGGLRERGESFLSAADEAIDRALSTDANAFLRQIRQESGQ